MNLESRYRQYHHENKKKDRKEELKQNAHEMRQYFDENMSDTRPKVNLAPSATPVSVSLLKEGDISKNVSF